jgi:hypothetical protein
MSAIPPRSNQRRQPVSHASRAVLLFALALLLVSAAQTIYRALLPTEGWSYTSRADFDVNTVIFRSNLLGDPTPIRAGDELLAIDGIGVDQVSFAGATPGNTWQVGQIVRYEVIRNGRTLGLEVPLKRWTAAGLATYAIGNIHLLGGWLAHLLMFGIGLFVMLKCPDSAAARALFLLATVLLANAISGGIVPDGPTTQLNTVFGLTALLSYWIWGILLAPTLFVLSLTFPRPKRVLQHRPWLVLLPYAAFWVLIAVFGWRGQIGYGLSGGFFVLSLLSVIHSAWTQRDAVSRAQLLWGLGGFTSAIALFLPMFVLVFVSIGGGDTSAIPSWQVDLANALTNFAFPVFTACLAVAIVRYRLFDIDVIIRRTLVYTALTTSLALVYLGSIVVLHALLRPIVGTDSDLVTVVSTLVIAALFRPLRQRIQQVIDRRFFRRRYDSHKTLQAFSARLRDETNLQTLTDDTLGVVRETLQPAHMSLWLREAHHDA